MLSRELARRMERLVGARVESYERVEGGYTPALRLPCRTAGGSLFAKVGTTPVTREALRREIHVYERLSGDFMPRFVAAEDDESEPVLVIEDLSPYHFSVSLAAALGRAGAGPASSDEQGDGLTEIRRRGRRRRDV